MLENGHEGTKARKLQRVDFVCLWIDPVGLHCVR
jgi:hypothetical protein